jgi:hypothetical protein
MLLLFTHVGKAGGLSFRDILYQLFGVRQVLIDSHTRWIFGPDHEKTFNEIKDPKLWHQKILIKRIRCICGHEAKLEKWLPYFENIIATSWVREPVDRLISQYYFQARIENWTDQSWPPNRRKLLAYAERFPNIQTSYFLPLDQVDRFQFIGLTEDYEKHVAIFCQRFGYGKAVTIPKINMNPERSFYPIAPKLRASILQLNLNDMELYTRVKENWNKGLYNK